MNQPRWEHVTSPFSVVTSIWLRHSPFSDADFRLLYEACAGHSDEWDHDDITVQACFDADRLDLGRVGTTPHPSGLCTEAAKRPSMIKWADGRACFGYVPKSVKDEWGIE